MMKTFLARFARWLLSTVEPDVVTATQAETPTVVYAPEPSTCDRCGQPWTAHVCAATNVEGDVAVCASCGGTLPKGSVRQHTGAWLCLECKRKIALEL